MEEEDNSVSLPSSSSSGVDVSLPHQHRRPGVGSRRPTPHRVCGSDGPMKEKDYFLVKLSQNGNLDGKQYESIHKQEAVCRLCSKMLGEADSILKTKCKCQFTLLHTTCGDQWSPMCNSCQQIILTVPVTISSFRPNSVKKPRNEEAGPCSIL